MIIITGQLVVQAEKVSEFQDRIKPVTDLATSEPGCIAYAMGIEDERSGRVVLLEKWSDEAHLLKHLERPEVAEFVGFLQEVVTDIELKMYDALHERDVAGVDTSS